MGCEVKHNGAAEGSIAATFYLAAVEEISDLLERLDCLAGTHRRLGLGLGGYGRL